MIITIVRFGVAAVFGTAVIAAHAGSVSWKPDTNVEIVVGVSPGGSNDRVARMIQRIWQEKRMLDKAAIVVNKPGGGGTIAWSYLNQHSGDGHFLAVNSVPLVINHIMGRTPLKHTDFTLIATLINEYVGFAVKTDSPLQSARDVIERLKVDPASLSIAFASSRGNMIHASVVLAMKAAGVEHHKLKTVVFNSGGESMIALLGGHVDLATGGVASVLPHLRAGKVRVIAISAPQRLGGSYASVPTWREQGVDVVAASWYVVLGPKGLAPAHVAFWEDRLARAAETAEWKSELEKNSWESNHLNGEATRRFLDTQYHMLRAVLTDLGLAK